MNTATTWLHGVCWRIYSDFFCSFFTGYILTLNESQYGTYIIRQNIDLVTSSSSTNPFTHFFDTLVLTLLLCFVYMIHYSVSVTTTTRTPSYPHPTTTPNPPQPDTQHIVGKLWCQIFVFCFFLLINLIHCWLSLCKSTRCVPFGRICGGVRLDSGRLSGSLTTLCVSLFFIPELENYQQFFLLTTVTTCGAELVSLLSFLLPMNNFKLYRGVCSGLLIISLFACSVSQASHTLCVMVLLFSCLLSFRKIPHWIFCLLIILSHDVHENPGPIGHQNSYFNFMNWNLNSLAKNDFS